MSSTWRVMYDPPARGALNMAVDEAIMLSVSEGGSLPTLRFYAWEPPAVSLGYFQRLEQEIDVARVTAAGFDLVRRPTGGRAVLHDDEVTYSISVREAEFPGSVVETYKRISTGLVEGLRILGMDAGMVAAQEAGHDPRAHSSAACFDAPSWYEVVSRGKKIIGSAQTRKMGTILQHGSIPITFSPERVTSVLALKSDAHRKRLASTLAIKAGGLREFLPRRPEFREVCLALEAGLSRCLDIDFVEQGLSARERERAQELLRGKYLDEKWNEKR